MTAQVSADERTQRDVLDPLADRTRPDENAPEPLAFVASRPNAYEPLDVDDVKAIDASFRKWVCQLRAVESLIP